MNFTVLANHTVKIKENEIVQLKLSEITFLFIIPAQSKENERKLANIESIQVIILFFERYFTVKQEMCLVYVTEFWRPFCCHYSQFHSEKGGVVLGSYLWD